MDIEINADMRRMINRFNRLTNAYIKSVRRNIIELVPKVIMLTIVQKVSPAVLSLNSSPAATNRLSASIRVRYIEMFFVLDTVLNLQRVVRAG